jgi:Protein of unknown function (DUF2905)
VRWLLVFLVVTLAFNMAAPWLQKFGFGKLPGDVRFSFFGREVYVPFTSTLLVAAVIWGVSHLI